MPFTGSRSGMKDFLLFLQAVFFVSIFLYLINIHQLDLHSSSSKGHQSSPDHPLSSRNILFSIASSSSTLPSRIPYIRMWHHPISHLNTTFLFLERAPPIPHSLLPTIIVPPDSSSLSSSHRIARILKHVVALNNPDIRWHVFGDDDAVFFTENLVTILGMYDHNRWYYIGCRSESYQQNEKFHFDMAFGGGGYAISASLARVLAKVLDSCLERYSHLYGSDARIFSCLAELGVGLTIQPGFHQVDVRGDLFGMLSAHPLSLVASLHHIEAVDPIFPGKSRIQALRHLFKAVRVDPARTLQHTVCYDRTNSLTVSISWGYSIQVYEGNLLLPELLSLQRTFRAWKRGKDTCFKPLYV